MGKNSTSDGRLSFLAYRQRHHEFRHFYTDRQIRIFKIVCISLALYGLFGATIMMRLVGGSESGRLIYSALLIISLLAFAGLVILNQFRRKIDAFIFERIFESMELLFIIGYIEWGFTCMYNSMLKGGSINYIIPFIVFMIVSMFIYTSPQHYFVIYVTCLVNAIYLLRKYANGSYDRTIMINILIFGALLTFASIVKYHTAQKEYLNRKEADDLKENLIANNEELISMNEELISTAEQLKERNETQRLFTASMNHELRSPLNGIIGLLQILKDDDTLSAGARENVVNAYSSSESLIQIVNDLLDFSKLESGEFTIFDEPYDLRKVVTNVNTVETPVAREKGLNFIIEADKKMPCMLQGDGLRIQQIMVNIVSNGIKYTDKGFVRMSLSMDSQLTLTIRVEDSGQGISKEAQEDLFKPYKRLNENKNKHIQGTGLGLSIVKHLVKQMCGDISVQSELGKGSIFTVRIPVKVTDPSVEFGDMASAAIPEKEIIPNLSGRLFLCVDDNPVNLTVFKGLFNGTGARLVLVSDGRQALDAAAKKKFDIIFLDHMMPGMDGIEVFQALRSGNTVNSQTPAVMLTANAGPEIRKHYLELGFNGYLSKPILKADLFKGIAEIDAQNRK